MEIFQGSHAAFAICNRVYHSVLSVHSYIRFKTSTHGLKVEDPFTAASRLDDDVRDCLVPVHVRVTPGHWVGSSEVHLLQFAGTKLSRCSWLSRGDVAVKCTVSSP